MIGKCEKIVSDACTNKNDKIHVQIYKIPETIGITNFKITFVDPRNNNEIANITSANTDDFRTPNLSNKRPNIGNTSELASIENRKILLSVILEMFNCSMSGSVNAQSPTLCAGTLATRVATDAKKITNP